MPTFEQEWISPILEVYKKRKITEEYTVLLGLNPIGQSICRSLYELIPFETVLVFNSPSFSTWNRYPVDIKPPVIPVQGMISEDLMIVFGDVIVKEYEWVTDMLFYLRGNVPSRFVIALSSYEGPTVGQVLSNKGERLLKRMGVPIGRSDFYDGLIAPLISLGPTLNLDPVVLFLEEREMGEVKIQIDDTIIYSEQIEDALSLLEKGLDFQRY
ncbi:MAG: hypothetical protein ACFFEF_05830 [Candidatus Thorarchaeota archaeon]